MSNEPLDIATLRSIIEGVRDHGTPIDGAIDYVRHLMQWEARDAVACLPPSGASPALTRLRAEVESVPARYTALHIDRADAAAILDAPAGDAREAAISLIAAERHRQVSVEGWTPEHDDEHDCGELTQAAACYAVGEAGFEIIEARDGDSDEDMFDRLWPWDAEWWKPGDRTRELAKAGALIVAEIERLQRASGIAIAAPPPRDREAIGRGFDGLKLTCLDSCNSRFDADPADPRECDCGADAHNAAVEALRRLVGA